MAEYSTVDCFLPCCCRCNGQFINVNSIHTRFCFSQHQHRHSVPSRHAILTFTATVLLNFLEIKYQGKAESPFETRRKTMLLAVISVIIYCFSYDAKLRLSSAHVSPYYVGVVRSSMAIFGPLSLASLSSILLPKSFCPLLFLLSVLFSLCEFPFSKFKFCWNWLQQVIKDKMHPEDHQQGQRRRRLADSVYQPQLLGIADSVYRRRLPQYATAQQAGTLPV